MESVENAISKVLDLKIFRGERPQTPYKFAKIGAHFKNTHCEFYEQFSCW